MKTFSFFGFLVFSLAAFAGCQVSPPLPPLPTPEQVAAVKILPGAALPPGCVFGAVFVSTEYYPAEAVEDLRAQAAAFGADVLVLGDFQRVEGGAPLDPFNQDSASMSGQGYECP